MSQGLKFDPEWRITLFTVLLVPVMVFLGSWQLQRADEKVQLAASFEQKQLRPPAPLVMALAGSGPEELAYLPVRLSGRFRQQQYFLLDNRMQGGQYGNEVVAVFELENGATALVNRGWVAADSARLSLPVVEPVTGEVELTGHVYVAPGDPYLLADEALTLGWPKQIQAVQMAKLSTAIDAPEGLFPYPVRIDSGQPGALDIDWQVINISPAKHHGYAVQWFAMAVALTLIYLLRCSNIGQIIRRNPTVEAKD